MDDALYGSRDKRGQWTPNKRPAREPLFVWPAQPKKFLMWIFGFPGYLWPWNALLLIASLVVWIYLTPSIETTRHFDFQWVLLVFLRNAALAVTVYGGLHALLYVRRRQATNFKYNAKWPDTDNSVFMFGSQTAENIFWAMCSGVPVWTAFEVVAWWMYSNGYITQIDIAQHPIYFAALLLVTPAWLKLQFFAVHRLIHLGPLYHIIHKVHHNNVNPGPWSGLSMHTFEHVLYFSGVLLFFAIPSSPLNIIFCLMIQALIPALGHVGFDKIKTEGDVYLDSDGYFHYLHHRYFEVNYGDTLIPFDEWFGTFHDGSAECDEAMYRRMKSEKYHRGGAKR